MPSDDALSTDAEVASPAFIDRDERGGEFDATSITAVLINRPRQELYEFWRDVSNLPRFAATVKEVEVHGGSRSTWTVEGPGGTDIELASEIVEDVPGQRIAWRSLEESDVDNEGWIEFRDNAFGRGTEVRAFISYDPPAGAVGKMVAKVMQREPRIQARRELRRFKQLMETGEISTSQAPDAAPRGPRHF